MLTKQEQQEIAERAKACKKEEELNWDQYSYDLLGVSRWRNDEELLDRIVELCDTSNMIGLPLDKDGEVIRIGDTVYDSDGDEYKVTGYKTLFEDTNIFLSNGSEPVYATVLAHYVTHKQPVTIGALVERIKNVMNDDSTTVWAYDELDDIATQLEHLGDNDE